MRLKVYAEDFLDNPVWAIKLLIRQVLLRGKEFTVCKLKGHKPISIKSYYGRGEVNNYRHCTLCYKTLTNTWESIQGTI